LLKVAAHRYRLFAEIRNRPLFERIKGIDFDTREGIHDFFHLIMPETFLNGMGGEEDPLAYIIRHTQLLPRHVIAIFNSIIARSHDSGRPDHRLTEDDIRSGVLDAEKLIAQQVLVPFYKIYPDLISSCEDILPDLSPVCTYNDLRKIERRFSHRIEEDVRSIWRTLFAMGVLGKIVNEGRTETAGAPKDARYCLATFHYNIEGTFGLETQEEYCFHPVFSRHFGISRKNTADRRAIYPANVDMITLI
jgi:hypothetical protein